MIILLASIRVNTSFTVYLITDKIRTFDKNKGGGVLSNLQNYYILVNGLALFLLFTHI